ncbi:MAG: hypothetical protein MPW15_12615 [Candidatus Manganitrophus sp.]|nr:hypothetical protein [Candidatus Manganitrophus sp.]
MERKARAGADSNGKDGIPSPPTSRCLFTSYQDDGRYITFYGDNHPIYAGNVVKAMASAKHGYPYVVNLFEKEIAAIDPAKQPARETQFKTLAQTLEESCMPRVHQVNRLTPTIVEVVVKAPLAGAEVRAGPVLPPAELRDRLARHRRTPACRWRASRSPAPGSTTRRGFCR